MGYGVWGSTLSLSKTLDLNTEGVLTHVGVEPRTLWLSVSSLGLHYDSPKSISYPNSFIIMHCSLGVFISALGRIRAVQKARKALGVTEAVHEKMWGNLI